MRLFKWEKKYHMTYVIDMRLVTQSCQTLCNPMDCSPPGSSIHGDSPGKNSRVGCHVLLQEIFPTQGSNTGLPRCGWILYYLSHQRSPRMLSGQPSAGNLPTQELNWGLLHRRQILYQLSYQRRPFYTSQPFKSKDLALFLLRGRASILIKKIHETNIQVSFSFTSFLSPSIN